MMESCRPLLQRRTICPPLRLLALLLVRLIWRPLANQWWCNFITQPRDRSGGYHRTQNSASERPPRQPSSLLTTVTTHTQHGRPPGPPTARLSTHPPAHNTIDTVPAMATPTPALPPAALNINARTPPQTIHRPPLRPTPNPASRSRPSTAHPTPQRHPLRLFNNSLVLAR
jgi:hypothetical protein